jgi:hypothetical protein
MQCGWVVARVGVENLGVESRNLLQMIVLRAADCAGMVVAWGASDQAGVCIELLTVA